MVDMGMVQSVSGMSQAETGAKIQVAVQKKALDAMEMQGNMLQELMAASGIGGGLDVRM